MQQKLFRNKLFLLIPLMIFAHSCCFLNKKTDKLHEVEIGMTVESVIKKLSLENIDIIQEPPLIYQGIMARMKDSTIVGISIERVPANHNDISEKGGMQLILKMKINGFAWKKANGEKKILGKQPKFWIE